MYILGPEEKVLCLMANEKCITFDALFQVKGSQLYNRHPLKAFHATVWEYSAQLTDDKCDDEIEQPSHKRAYTFAQECADDI